MAYVIISSQINNQHVLDLVEQAKEQKRMNNENKTPIRKSNGANSLYNMLEFNSPLKNQK